LKFSDRPVFTRVLFRECVGGCGLDWGWTVSAGWGLWVATSAASGQFRPAPALVKVKSDVGAEMGWRSIVPVAQADVKATAKIDPLKQTPRKSFHCSQAALNLMSPGHKDMWRLGRGIACTN
jgi:hypothetical protein